MTRRNNTMQTQNAPKQQLILISAGLVLLIAAAFEPLRHNGFTVYDDNDYIRENTYVKSGLTWQSVTWAFTSGRASNWHPLTWLSHMVDIELFGLNPLGHHLHNLLLHTASTVLLFWLLYIMTGSVWPSAFTAMVFGIHPLRVESVAWAAERKDVLCMLFFMLTVAAYLYYVKRGSIGRYMLVMLCFALGLMAKPMLVTLPIVLLLLDIWPLKRTQNFIDKRNPQKQTMSFLNLIAEKIPLLLLVMTSCIVTYTVQKAGGSVNDISLQTRIVNALFSYLAYLGKIFWPHNLAALYPFPVGPYPLWKPVAGSILLFVLSGIAVYYYSRKSWLFTGWFWYVVTLIPTIGLIQVGNQAMADRYTYLPSIGIVIMLSWSVVQVSAKWRHQTLIIGTLTIVAAIAMITTTRHQLRFWKDDVSLFEHALAVTENNAVMQNNLGGTFWKQGKEAQAFEHIQKALQLVPAFPDANINMAAILFKRKDYDKAMDCLYKALKANPDSFQANNNLALVLIELKRYDQAARYLLTALKNTEDNADIYYNMGIVLGAQKKTDEAADAYEQAIKLDHNHYEAMNELGAIKYKQGLLDEAVGYFRQCVQRDPNYVKAYSNLGLALQKQKKFEESISYCLKALQIEPDFADTWYNLALSQQTLARFQSACQSYHKALQFDPNSIGALNNLAWLLAVNPDTQIQKPAEAVLLAQKACQLTSFEDAGILDTLAAAYAANSQFKEAIETAQKALDAARAAGKTEMAEGISSRLRLYQAGKPFYESPPR
jgi:protein O-mannosyl-transferase